MKRHMTRRAFLRAAFGTGALVMLGAACAPAAPAPTAAPTPPPAKPESPPTVAPTTPASKTEAQPTAAPKPAATAPAKPAVAGGRLVVAVSQWGIETPFAWRSAQGEKPLWKSVHDYLIRANPRTLQREPALALEWKPSADYRTWTFKLRQGVMFHENYGELTADDVRFTIEQHRKPDAQGGDAQFFRTQLEQIETPDKYTVAMRFKEPLWEVPIHFLDTTGYQGISSKKYVETVGEEKAALHPIGTGPYRHVDGKQGAEHRFEAVPNHWRVTPAFKELVIRRMPDPASRLAALRAGEVDIVQVDGDYLRQARQAGLQVHEVSDSTQYWVALPGQTSPNVPDYCPRCAWVGDSAESKSVENALKVRQALNLAVNKKAIIDNLWAGAGSASPFAYWYAPAEKGFSQDWKVPAYDPAKARQLLAEAGYPNGFEITASPTIYLYAPDGPDVMEAVALDWEKIGLKVKRVPEDAASFLAKLRAGKTGPAAWIAGGPPQAAPSIIWRRTLRSDQSFHIVADGPFDKDIDGIAAELDDDKRARLMHDFAQKLYDGYHGVLLGVKSSTWALSKKVGDWPTIAYVPAENNYEYITAAG